MPLLGIQPKPKPLDQTQIQSQVFIKKKNNVDCLNVFFFFSGDGAIPSTSMNPQSFLKQHSKEQEAFKRFSECINTDVDDHLDLTLEQEEQFLMQYLSLLS